MLSTALAAVKRGYKALARSTKTDSASEFLASPRCPHHPRTDGGTVLHTPVHQARFSACSRLAQRLGAGDDVEEFLGDVVLALHGRPGFKKPLSVSSMLP